MKRISVFCNDAPPTRSHSLGDEVLNAVPTQKLLLMPRTWQGDLEPVLDTYLEQLRPLDTPFSSGRILHAEDIGHVLDLGTVWLGSFRDRLSASYDEKPGAMDATEVLQQVEAVRRAMATGDPRAVADGLRRLRDAARKVSDAARRRDEEQRTGAFSEGRRIADSARQRITSINASNRAFHAVTPQLDSSGRVRWRTRDAAPTQSTAFRDAQHAARQAATPRERIGAMNRAAKAFWSSGKPPTITAVVLGRAQAPTSIAEINAGNRLFWSRRD